MALYKESTKTKPILFFETFVNNEALSSYEEMFYCDPINPSQESFREKGYILYTKDTYVNDEIFEPVKEYFIEKLGNLFKAQRTVSINFLENRKDELEYQNIKCDIFIEKQLDKIQRLKTNIEKITICKVLIIEVLNTLEKNIKEIGSINQASITKTTLRETKNPFFENKFFTKKSILIKLYDIAIEHRIVDEDIVLQDAFINVFMASNPQKIDDKIVFKSDNQIAVFFLNSISPFFDNLTHSRIVKSESFYNKKNKKFNQTDLDTAKNRYLKNSNSSKFEKIYNDISRILPKKK